ncbi:MAG: hypothetical protein V4614_07045 [Pseudomonadota bacterium]
MQLAYHRLKPNHTPKRCTTMPYGKHPYHTFRRSILVVAVTVLFDWSVLGSAQVALAQDSKGSAALPSVTVAAKGNRDPVEKSYRKMISGVDLFEKMRAAAAPNSTLRFKLLPRRQETDMDNIVVEVLGDTVSFLVPVTPDHTFALPRDAKALGENAVVQPNRRSQTMTWRTEIRTPGLPPHTRRLGDLRLECEVGMEAGLVSNDRSIIGRIASSIADIGYCTRGDTRYLFFAERPLFGVTLIAGPRREALPVDRLYAAASVDKNLREDLPYCDCQVLLDRTYFLPLGDKNWPDGTLVEFDYMDD